MNATTALLLFGLAMTVSSLGFRRVVYFVSLGYGFSITLQALSCLVSFWDTLTWPVGAQVGLLAVYGARLGTYLLRREGSPAYQQELEDSQQRAAGITVPKKLLIWVGVSVLYVLMFSPALANLTGAPDERVVWLGAALMGLGLGLETTADWQKDAFKTRRPRDYCDVGLYRYSRCPNYFGEIVFWGGNFLAGMSAYRGAGWWAAASAGLVCIVLIMMGSTKRLEGKQDARYGERPEYQRYITSVPVLFPFLPVYSLKKVRVYLE